MTVTSHQPKYKFQYVTILYSDLQELHNYMNALPKSYVVCSPKVVPSEFTTVKTPCKLLLDITDEELLFLKLKFKTYDVDEHKSSK